MKTLRQLGIILPLFLTALTLVGQEKRSASDSLLLHPEEMKYLKNIKQLTFGGNNAEAYGLSTTPSWYFSLTSRNGAIPATRCFT